MLDTSYGVGGSGNRPRLIARCAAAPDCQGGAFSLSTASAGDDKSRATVASAAILPPKAFNGAADGRDADETSGERGAGWYQYLYLVLSVIPPSPVRGERARDPSIVRMDQPPPS